MSEEDLGDEFCITKLSRQDFVEAGIPLSVVEGLSDEVMTAVARRMGELYVEYGSFWEDITQSLEYVQEKRQSAANQESS